jgi:hypothetical protein
VTNNPLALAASHGQRESAFLITSRARSSASTSSRFLLSPAAGIESVAQIARVGSVHAKNGVFDIFHRPDIHLVAKNVALRNEPAQFIQKFGRFHLTDAFNEQLSVNRRAGESHCFQECDFTSAKIYFTTHTKCVNESRVVTQLIISVARAHPFQSNPKCLRAGGRHWF